MRYTIVDKKYISYIFYFFDYFSIPIKFDDKCKTNPNIRLFFLHKHDISVSSIGSASNNLESCLVAKTAFEIAKDINYNVCIPSPFSVILVTRHFNDGSIQVVLYIQCILRTNCIESAHWTKPSSRLASLSLRLNDTN